MSETAQENAPSKRIAKNVERRRKAEERAASLRKERLIKEIELGALNTSRYRRAWRETMMRIKMPTVKENARVAWRTFERALDIKDYSIATLLDALDEAEDQYRRNESHRVEIIDRLLRMYKSTVDEKARRHQRNVRGTLNEAGEALGAMADRQNEAELFLRGIARNIEQRRRELLDDTSSNTLSKIDAFVEDNRDARRTEVAIMENRLANLWVELRGGILSDYQESTKHRRKARDVLEAKDAKEREIVERQIGRTATLFQSIGRLREKILAHRENSGRKIRNIVDENDFFHRAYKAVKHRFAADRKEDNTQLTVITVEYNRALKRLKQIASKAERVLSLARVCRKYETQDEKILPPFAEPAEDDQDREIIVRKSSLMPEWERAIEITNDYLRLDNFWRRYGVVYTITTELRLERDELKSESVRLRDRLKRCLSAEELTTM